MTNHFHPNLGPNPFLLFPGILLVLSSALFLVSCNPQPVTPVPPPLGPDAVSFLGTTKNQNIFDPWYVAPCREEAKPVLMPESKAYDSVNDPALRVFGLIVDSRDHRYTGTAAALTAYRNAKVADYGTKTNQYWRETSYKNVSVSWTMPDAVVQLSGTYDDYFNRPFVAASLQTQGLTGRFPLNLNGTATATLHVRDAKKRNKDIVIAPNGTFPNAAALAIAFQNAADAVTGVPGDWVNCTASGSEVVCQLGNLETAEASFIRVKSGAQLAMLGLDGPMEAPGAGSVPASLTGKSVGFPLTIPAGTRVDIEVRGKGDPNDEDAKVRQFQIPLAAGSVANPAALANLLLPTLNSEFNWVESWDAGPSRLGLRLLSSESNDYAAIRVIGGVNLQNLGLDGPIRVDGVISQPGTITVRGDISDIIGQALSLYLAQRAAATNTPIDLAHEDDLLALFNNEMGNFESYLVLFTEDTTGIDGRRAGARASNSFNIRVPGAGGYVFTTQKQAGGMVGSGLRPWHVWAHELGHVLGFLDHYWKATYSQTFNRTHDYLNAWTMMDTDAAASHVDAWHKRKIRWIPPKQIADVPAPVNGLPQTHAFEMIPLEFQPADYPGFGTPAEPVRQLLRIKLSEHHWIYVENRQPAAIASKNLPDDALGLSPPDASGQAGGILVTDTADPFSEVLYRPAVTSLNPHGTGVPVVPAIVQSRALHPGDSLDLNTTYPAYDGIRIRVTRAIPSPMSGTPEILAVEVDRWPGKFMDLELRPWHAPTEYATPDIWFDWAGTGEELYPGVDPPLGTGDEVHWHPDGKVVMTIRVRVHNRGNLDATGVVVRTSINEPMGMGDKGTFVALPDSAPQDIPGGQSRDFAFEWKPTASAHTCVRAEIFTHSTAYGELDLNNNSAQENVTTFSPAAGSPYQPVDFAFKVNNDFPHPIVVDLMPSGLAPGMKLELERKYVVLAADEEITLHGRLWLDENVIRPGPRGRRCDYRFNLHAMQRTEDSVLPFGGISIGVAPGVKSQLVHQEIVRDAGGTAIYGRLEGDYRSNQQVDAALVGSDGKTYEGTAKTGNNGSFKIVVPKVPSGPGNLMLFYFGPDMARSYLGPIKITLP